MLQLQPKKRLKTRESWRKQDLRGKIQQDTGVMVENEANTSERGRAERNHLQRGGVVQAYGMRAKGFCLRYHRGLFSHRPLLSFFYTQFGRLVYCKEFQMFELIYINGFHGDIILHHRH